MKWNKLSGKWNELGGSIFLLIIGAFTCFEARKFEIGATVNPGPGYFPLFLGVAMIILSLAMIIKDTMEGDSENRSLWKNLNWGKILYTLIALTLYGLFLQPLGYLIATFALMFILFWVTGGQRWWGGLISSTITTSISFILFKVWLGVHLPIGLWGGF